MSGDERAAWRELQAAAAVILARYPGTLWTDEENALKRVAALAERGAA